MLLTVTVFLETAVLSLAGISALAMLLGIARRQGWQGPQVHRWPLNAVHLATQLAVGLLVIAVGFNLMLAIGGLPHARPQLLDWLALSMTIAAVVVSLWDRAARFSLAGLYCLGWTAISLESLHRDVAPGGLFAWGVVCEWAGFVLIAGLAGWWFRRSARGTPQLKVLSDRTFWPDTWFLVTQAGLTVAIAVIAGWIALDFSFDGVGQGVALFGLSGRLAACSAALMLVGATILMAWQSSGRWRAGWQYAAMVAGVLFTSSLGWARLENLASGDDPLWLAASTNLMISAAMMTLLTRFGLARVLPNSGDWIVRARQAAPIFGCLALLTLVVVLVGMSLR